MGRLRSARIDGGLGAIPAYGVAGGIAEDSLFDLYRDIFCIWQDRVTTSALPPIGRHRRRKPSFTDCLIKADRAYHDGQTSHERPS